MSRRRPAQTTAMSCGVCGATVADVYVCTDCLDRYHGHLARVPSVVADLRIEHTRQAVKGGQISGRGTGEQPLPYVPAASEAMTNLYTALVTACRALVLDGDLPAPGVASVCAWLAAREASIPLRAEGPDIVAELDRCMARAMRVCDNPPEKVYIGNCPTCAAANPDAEPVRMYAARGAVVHHCTQCQSPWMVAESLARLEQELADYRLTFAEVELATGGRIKADRVRKWSERGHLERTAAGVRFGDVLGVEARMAS